MVTNHTLEGWRDPPNQRGTFDILKTCIGTTLLLCWSSVCPNVPSSQRGNLGRFASKLQLFLLSILGPEWVFVIALGQLNQAFRARKAFHEKGHTNWSLRHCFFVNMGGLHLIFPDREAAGERSFPVDCKQLLQLEEHNLIEIPQITKEDIDDRNKSDSLARSIAIVQTIWFTSDSLGRAGQGLSLTTLELTTLAFVFLMTACSICWWRKPMDVTRPILVPVEKDLSTILQETNAPTPLRGRTPLSYLTRREWFMSQFWYFYTHLLWKLRLLPGKLPAPAQAEHFASIDFPELDIKWEIVGAPLVAMYSAIFLAAWNFEFPTSTELHLWRIASAFTLAYGCLSDVIAGSYHQSAMLNRWWINVRGFIGLREPRRDDGRPRKTSTKPPEDSHKPTPWLHRIRTWSSKLRNLSADQDPELAISLRWSIPATILNVVYIISRLFILAEDFAALRSLPASAYQTVNYGPYSPIL